MKHFIDDFSIYADGGKSSIAAELFAAELEARTGRAPGFTDNSGKARFAFFTDGRDNKDSFTVKSESGRTVFTAGGVRGLVYAFALFLRKSVFDGGFFETVRDISGEYSPAKRIRGHQLGYRTTPNTYDAWSYDDYRRYYLDIMFMGCNTVEHIPYESGKSKRNPLMKYDEEEFLTEASRMADELDLDVSLWIPNSADETDESAAERRKALVEKLPRVNAVFPPGGDPGCLPAKEFLQRCRAIGKAVKSVREDVEIWPSAQAPHEFDNWGDEFLAELRKDSSYIDGIIMGPNHILPLDKLRESVPDCLPIRFYPDITHNLRCEYPVHFDRDDWHFALCAGLGRECTNPRPFEYAHLHKITRDFVCGSVSYSEGVTDDVNKFVWSSLDFDPRADVNEMLADYARLFFWSVPEDLIARAITGLEQNWEGDPAENEGIENTYNLFHSLSEKYPRLNENWRFVQLLFRAECDLILRHRRCFELSLIEKAKALILKGDIEGAKAVLTTDYDCDYKELRADIERLGERLFKLIGLQLDVERYFADNPERGAVLDTIDLPVTDRMWLLNRIEYSEKFDEDERLKFLEKVVNRNRVESGELYYSVAENEIAGSGLAQEGEVYINVLADRVNINDGRLPTCLFKIFDNTSFRMRADCFTPGKDYRLIVSFVKKNIETAENLTITANGKMICASNAKGFENAEYDEEMLCDIFSSREYLLPAGMFENGGLTLVMEEEKNCVMFAELRIVRA
ncbi:MAG: hypothetical protein II702_02075 [Clostridia bacterium]|nr:hypothetical protein [Clostridia bacterium]